MRIVMCHSKLCGLIACVVLPLAVGCMSTQETIRGQSPAGPGPAAVQPAGGFHGNTAGPVYHAGGCGYGQCDPCQTCGDCEGRCGHRLPGAGLRDLRNGPGGAWYPTHHHWFNYEAPRNLQYPASNVPPATIVYPYYTVKGPDDFFKAY